MSSSNKITKVALIGGTGNLGSQVLIALVANKQFNITLITRSENPKLPAGVDASQLTILIGSYTSSSFLTNALFGIDAVVLALHYTAVPEPETGIISAAAEAGVKYIFPVEYGSDVAHPSIADIPLNAVKEGPRKKAEELGLKWIGVVTGPWIEFSLKAGMWQINVPSRSATILSGGTTKFNTTTLRTTGRAIAGILALPLESSDANQKSLQDFASKQVYVSSFLTSQREVFEAVLKVTGTTEGEWKIENKDADEFALDGKEKTQMGVWMGMANWLFGRLMSEGHGGNYEKKGLVNELLGLEKEDLESVVREALSA